MLPMTGRDILADPCKSAKVSCVICLQQRQQQHVRCAIKVLHFRKSSLNAAVQTHFPSQANREDVASLVFLRYYTVSRQTLVSRQARFVFRVWNQVEG